MGEFSLTCKTPLISVVIPTYNRAHCLKDAIDSVLAQTYQNFEIIVVDDGSTDDTMGKLARYKTDIRYLYQKNGGASAARNLGINEANGKWIAFLDSDDTWEPDKLKFQLRDLTLYPNAVAHMVDISIFEGPEMLCSSLFELRRSFQDFSSHPFRIHPLVDVMKIQFFTSSWIVKRDVFDVVGCFNPSLNVFEDFDLLSRIALEGPFVINCYMGALIKRQRNDIHPLSDLYRTRKIESIGNLIHTYKRLKSDARLTHHENKLVRRALGGALMETSNEYKEQTEYIKSFFFCAMSILEDPNPRSFARALWHLTGLHSFSSNRGNNRNGYLRRSESDR